MTSTYAFETSAEIVSGMGAVGSLMLSLLFQGDLLDDLSQALEG